MAQAILDGADEATREELARLLFYRDLETIRRPKPLLDPNDYVLKTVDVYDHSNQLAAGPVHGQAPIPRIGGGGYLPQPTWFKGRLAAKAGNVLFRAINLDEEDEVDAIGPDDQKDPPPPSGPLTDMRINIADARTLIGYTKPFESEFPLEVAAAKTAGNEFADQESVFQARDWKWVLSKYKGRIVLYKGLPMLEEVVFIKHPNFWMAEDTHGKIIPSGNCYWLSLALLLYGDASCWLRVKAEHLSYLEKVLKDENHPRHAFYTRENLYSTLTKATGPKSMSGHNVWEGQVNLWEKLHMPGCWLNEDICILTADVYGVFVVLYKYNIPKHPRFQDKVYDMKTFGAYNNRHIFICYAVSLPSHPPPPLTIHLTFPHRMPTTSNRSSRTTSTPTNSNSPASPLPRQSATSSPRANRSAPAMAPSTTCGDRPPRSQRR